MNVPKISYDGRPAAEVPALLDAAGIPWNPIACDRWHTSDDPPAVRFRIAHTGKLILLQFHVDDNEVLADVAEDNGPVWENSCCEFFLSPDGNDRYYNFECNAIGTLLMNGGGIRPARSAAPDEARLSVQRWSSLGSTPFGSREGDCAWDLVEIIPADALYLHAIDTLDGRTMTANFYKCGDRLRKPHFLSWSPIDLPQPNFHCPQFFAPLTFE